LAEGAGPVAGQPQLSGDAVARKDRGTSPDRRLAPARRAARTDPLESLRAE